MRVEESGTDKAAHIAVKFCREKEKETYFWRVVGQGIALEGRKELKEWNVLSLVFLASQCRTV